MNSGQKIIGIRRGDQDDVDIVHENDADESQTDAAEEADETSLEVSEIGEEYDPRFEEYYDDADGFYEAQTSFATYLPPSLFGLATAIWTGLLLWINRDIFTTLPTAKAGIDLFSTWCVPVLTFAVIYLLYMRSSTREARRFVDVSNNLRAESEQLETRLQTVNNELSIAREFLASETRELETLGAISTEKMTVAGRDIQTALRDGLKNMTKLEEVGGSAYQNLERLRDHLPVVISTAKDVTNQIGNSGRAAQTEMAAMIKTLKRAGEVGTAAKASMDELTGATTASLQNLEDTAARASDQINAQIADAEKGSVSIAQVLQKSAAEVVGAMHTARTHLSEEASQSAETLKSDLDALEASITSVGQVADEEETRVKALVAELHESVARVNEEVAELDNESGDKTAKLAFAMTALEQNSAELRVSLEQGHSTADGMIERMEKLLTALDSSARELDETLPAAFDRMTKSSTKSLTMIGSIAGEAEKAGAASDTVLAKISKADAEILAQLDQLAKLKEDGELTAVDLLAKVNTLGESIAAVRNDSETLAETSSEKLINALLRIKETARQASEHSRDALDKSISASTDKFEKVTEEALDKIIQTKIDAIAPRLEEAIANASQSANATTAHLQTQLGQITTMTENLERRLALATERSEKTSDESFTRRVALLTESLNSTAIDVTKLLSNEVTDTEWAAYLKGDRGIFTRRAVRLLDASEVKEILAEYENNSEFHEHVNRYIHDFETMLRGVLSTRDGSAISVTLLSSDIGKLYVALAQAIERLRA